MIMPAAAAAPRRRRASSVSKSIMRRSLERRVSQTEC
jgi:hypothetical protein